VATDFTAMIYSHNDTAYEKEMYVMSVDDSAKTVKVKFSGAVSNSYYIQLASTQNGRLDCDALQLAVHGSITSVSPLTGSAYGGALVTITGENFSDNPLDNPVKIGSNYCYVITTSTT
jgi:4-aminobutyrate aminotransferase-like enzyme